VFAIVAAVLFGLSLIFELTGTSLDRINPTTLNTAGLLCVALHLAGGPLLVQLCTGGIVFAVAYLGILRALGVLPPVRAWIPQKAPLVLIREAA